MLVVVIAAALAPNAGIAAATSSCQYNNCNSTQNSFPWTYVVIGVAALVAAALVTLLLFRRRGGGETGAAGQTSPGPSREAGEEKAEPAPNEPSGAAEPAPEAYDEGTPDSSQPGGGAPASDDIDSLMDELDKISGNGN